MNEADEDHNSSSKFENKKLRAKPPPIHKIINIDIELCDTYIESKYTRIVKSKRMTPTNRNLQKIHTNL